MSQYSTGTVAVTVGSPVVTGTGTTWGGGAVKQGNYLYFPGVVGRWQVASVASNTSLTLTTPITGVAAGTGRSYVIVRDFTPNRFYPLMAKGDTETAQIYSDCVTMIDAEFQTRSTGSVILNQETLSASTSYPLILRAPAALQITRMSYVTRTNTQGISLRVAGTAPNGFSSLAANTTLKVIEANGVAPNPSPAPAGVGTLIDIMTVGGAVTATGLVVQIDYRLV